MSNSSNSITYKDIENLPVKLFKQLNIPHSLKREFLIMRILTECKGDVDINLLLIRIHKDNGEVVNRRNMWKILSSMKQRGLIETADKKGYYRIKKQ